MLFRDLIGLVLSLYLPSAVLKSTSVSWKGAFHAAELVPWLLGLVPCFCSCLLMACLWWPAGLAFLRPTGPWQAESCWPQGTTVQTADWGTTSSPLRRRPLLVLELYLRGRLLGDYELHSRNVVCGHQLGAFPVLLHLEGFSQKRAYTFVWNPSFCDCYLWDTARLPGHQHLHLWSHETMYICILLKAVPIFKEDIVITLSLAMSFAEDYG